MDKDRILDVDDLKGMTILAADSGERLGKVTDAIINPTGGRLLGVTLKTGDGDSRVLPVQELRIGEDAVMAAPGARPRLADDIDTLRDGVATADGIIGANVVTDSGKLLGKISEVHVSLEHPRTIYRIAESTIQKWFGGGFFIPGDAAHGYAADRPRIIVPSDLEDRYAADSIAEALHRNEQGARS